VHREADQEEMTLVWGLSGAWFDADGLGIGSSAIRFAGPHEAHLDAIAGRRCRRLPQINPPRALSSAEAFQLSTESSRQVPQSWIHYIPTKGGHCDGGFALVGSAGARAVEQRFRPV